MIDTPYDSLAAWVQKLGSAELPVLRRSVQDLVLMRENADSTSVRTIAQVVMRDPLLTLCILQYVEAHRGRRQITDLTTIERALVMIGTGPFFRDFPRLCAVEDRLSNHPKAIVGLLKVIARSRKASAWAREWAVMRHDTEADEVTLATLLHDVSEILMWCFAPTLALAARDMQQRYQGMRSSAIQEQVYRIRLDDLLLELGHKWRLPELLMTLLDPAKSDHPRVRNVKLACDLARHSAHGWNDAALPDDYKAICDLLRIDHSTLMRKLGLETPD